jgi:cell division protein FtsW
MGRFSLFSLLAAVSLLLTLGLVTLASTSYFSEEAGGEGYNMLHSQAQWLAISIVLCVVVSCLDFNVWYRFRWVVFGVAVFGLVLCYVPFVSEVVNGARRWVSLKNIGLGFVHLQPSEFAKIACAIVMASWYVRFEPHTHEFKRGFLFPGLIALTLVGLVAGEVDLGSATLLAALSLGIMFVAGARMIFVLPLLISALGALALVVWRMPNRVARVLAFLDLEKYKDGLGLQQWRALLCFGSGGPFGLGLGNGRQKNGFLPEPNTDFIFPNIGEELGLAGAGFVVLMFVVLAVAGMWIAFHAPNRFGRLLGFGIVLTLAMEGLLNMGVTTALLPNKGLPLPFLSYGGSSLLSAMIGVGILISIHRQSSYESKKDLLQLRRRRMTAAA